MKLVLVTVVLALTGSRVVHADDDPGMQLMMVMMRSPAISADGKHVAIYSEDPGPDAGAKTSLAVFTVAGALERRVSVVPPAVDANKASAAASTLTKLLDDGGYKRMAPVARTGSGDPAGARAFNAALTSGDLVADIALAGRKLTISGTRGGKPFAPISRTLPAKDGPCGKVERYSLPNAMSGYDAKTGTLAFPVQASTKDSVCFAHTFVVSIK